MKAVLLLPFLLALLSAPDAAAPVRAGEHDWQVDTVHSSVVFKVVHAKASNFYGTFETVTGEVTLDPASPADGKVRLEIPVDSVRTRDEKRDGHLEGPDFFNAKENPAITFVSTKITAKDEGRYDVTGDLEIAGVSQSVTLAVAKTGEGEFYGPRLGYEATFAIQRSKFGMNYGLAQGALGDQVTVTVALELTQKK